MAARLQFAAGLLRDLQHAETCTAFRTELFIRQLRAERGSDLLWRHGIDVLYGLYKALGVFTGGAVADQYHKVIAFYAPFKRHFTRTVIALGVVQ